MQADLLSPRGVQWPFSEFTLCNPLMTTPRPWAKGRRLAARSRLPVVTTGDSMHRIRSDDPPAMSMNITSSSSRDSCLSRNSLPQPPVHIDITHRPLPPYRGPYTGGYNGWFWNTQALFAAETDNQSRKQAFVSKLVETSDFLGVAETHGTDGKLITAIKRQGVTPLWSHGSSRIGGIGLLLKDSFLKHFNPMQKRDWTELARVGLADSGSTDHWVDWISMWCICTRGIAIRTARTVLKLPTCWHNSWPQRRTDSQS